MTSGKIVTRFAPSPTGALHIGGSRTALFSWAYARGRGGTFLLRFEDTDQTRSTSASAKSILEDLKWIGLDWDEEPCRQSDRLDLYNEQIQKLIDAGSAYEDDGAIRFKVTRDVVIMDAVFGRVDVKAADVEDFVIRKADGFPTFHLAVVVDDALMGVTHVIRGQEHLSNTPKHAALYDALGFPRPVWAHTPSILNPDGSKMSKRDKAKAAREAAKGNRPEGVENLDAFLEKKTDDGAIALAIAAKLGLQLPEIEVADFRRSGYLPSALNNYVALLGWNPGGDIEKFDMAFLCEKFDLDRIGKANSKFDRAKLLSFNADAIVAMPPEDFQSALAAALPEIAAKLGDRLGMFAQAYQPRAKTLIDPAQQGAFFFVADDAIVFDDKAVQKVLAKSDGFALLAELRGTLAAIEPWSGNAAHEAIKKMGEDKQINMGKIAQPLRVAVSGNTVSPPIDVTLDILGKESTLRRIDRCLALSNEA